MALWMADTFGGSLTAGRARRLEGDKLTSGGGGGSGGRTSYVRKSGMSSRRWLVSHAENHEQSFQRIETEM